jgi:hypothetical protein
MRTLVAGALCFLASCVVVITGIVVGIGTTVVLVILVLNHTITLGLGLIIFFLGLPAIEGVLMMITSLVATGLVGVASLFDREYVHQWDF